MSLQKELGWLMRSLPPASCRLREALRIAPRAVELVLHRAPHDIQAGAPLIGWMESVGCRRQALLLLETLTASNQQ